MIKAHQGLWIGMLTLTFGLAAQASPPSQPWLGKAPPLPAPKGQVLRVNTVEQLYAAAEQLRPGGTILLTDGHYRLSRMLSITADHATLRSASGNRHAVVLDGHGALGEGVGVSKCTGATIADLTVQNVKWNGIKISSELGAQRVTVYNCVLHNIWQRGVKAPHVPRDKQKKLSPRDCRVQFCLFYNDRPKKFTDDKTDTSRTFNGNYIGGIDAKNTINWTISDNVFVGIQGRTREGRGAVYISENGVGCVIERNIIIDCDIAIALGNPTLGYSPRQAVRCIARNNFVTRCPETGILACHTQDCQVLNNTIHDPTSRLGRLIFIQHANDGLIVANNLISGPSMRVTSKSKVTYSNNVINKDLTRLFADVDNGNLHLKTIAKGIVDAGTRLALVSHDIDNQPRLNLPDVGADEYRPADAKLLVISPKLGQPPLPIRPRVAVKQLHEKDKAPAAGISKNRVADAPAPKVDPDKYPGKHYWLDNMRRLHANFNGTRGYVAQIGDSITISQAFWTPLLYGDPEKYLTGDDGLPKLPAVGKPWREVIGGLKNKGMKYCNGSGWQVGYILRTIDGMLRREKPEVAIIMVGTNDIGSGKLPKPYEEALQRIVQKCLDANCIPIMNTIPPRRDHDEAVADANRVIRRVAYRLKVPLVDFHAELVRRRPGDTWDGTLIAPDGVHPTGGKTVDFSDDNLNHCGFALRNWLNFQAYRQVYFRVLHPELIEAAEKNADSDNDKVGRLNPRNALLDAPVLLFAVTGVCSVVRGL